MTTMLTDGVVRELIPARPEAGHKGTFGHVVIFAGSTGFSGAAKLAAEGALRSGVGLVTAGVPATIAPTVASKLLEGMVRPLPTTHEGGFGREAFEPALEFVATKQAAVLGPGIGWVSETERFVSCMVSHCPTPLVIDADGLNCLSACMETLIDAEGPRLLTPHPGEMARLLSISTAEVQANREETARTLAMRYGCTVTLKGHHTVIADGQGEVWINPTGNVGMATGGTGDVLAGLLGGLLAQGVDVKDAARIGVYIHGLAGDIAAARKTSRGMLARDLADAIPDAWRLLEMRRP